MADATAKPHAPIPPSAVEKLIRMRIEQVHRESIAVLEKARREVGASLEPVLPPSAQERAVLTFPDWIHAREPSFFAKVLTERGTVHADLRGDYERRLGAYVRAWSKNTNGTGGPMKLVVVEVSELQTIIREAVLDAVGAPQRDDWVDARGAPMGRRAFLKLASEGAFPVSLVGNKYMARRSDVDAYLERQRICRESSLPEPESSTASRPDASGGVAPDGDPIARELAAGRLRMMKNNE